jgi:predicted PurR-regulated permease PerM
MTPDPNARESWTRAGIRVWTAIGVLILVALGAYALGAVFSALVPFIIGALIVLLLRRPVAWLVSRRMNRLLAVALCYLTAMAVVAIVLTFIIPPIYQQVAGFVGHLPGYTQRAYSLWDRLVVHPRAHGGIPTWLQSIALGLRDQLVAGAGSWSQAIASSAVATGGSIAGGVIGFVLALIIGFYTLADLPRLQKEILTVVGPRARDEVTHVGKTVTRVLGGWLRGTLIQSSVVAVLFTVGLSIAGVPYALAIGVIGGLFNVVPYVGPVITGLLAASAGLFVSPLTALLALLVVVIVQQFDSLIMAPRIMSEQVDLHPLLVILALLVGATLFGIPGMVLSVPVAAIMKGLFVYWFERGTERRIGSQDGVLFRETVPDGEKSESGKPAGQGGD